MFDVFGENHLTRINTSVGAEDIMAFKNLIKQKKHLNAYLKLMMIKAYHILKQSKKGMGKEKNYHDRYCFYIGSL